VVKILRPNVRQQIEQDLEILYAVARLAQRYWIDGRRLRPVEVVAEYERTVLAELDLMREAANAAQLRRNFRGSTQIYVPRIYWDYCRPGAMVMERIKGISISDREGLQSAGTDIRKLAVNGVEIFFTQVFRDNFFHADMHPGNIFVDVSDPANPRYAAVDFGIVGTLDDRDRRYLAENFLAFFDRDYHRVATLHGDSGWVPPGTRVADLESAIRTVCEPIFNKPLKDISFGQVLLQLFQTARQFNMEIQPQLMLLQKTLVNIEGLGRELYPELDLWETGQPVLKAWMAEQSGARATVQRIRRDLPEIRYTLERLPAVAGRLVDQIMADRADPKPDRKIGYERDRRWYLGFCGATLLIAGALCTGLNAAPAWLGWAGGAAGLALLWFGRPRPSRDTNR
jgi:ubiquinone biosynthesis protein